MKRQGGGKAWGKERERHGEEKEKAWGERKGKRKGNRGGIRGLVVERKQERERRRSERMGCRKRGGRGRRIDEDEWREKRLSRILLSLKVTHHPAEQGK